MTEIEICEPCCTSLKANRNPLASGVAGILVRVPFHSPSLSFFLSLFHLSSFFFLSFFTFLFFLFLSVSSSLFLFLPCLSLSFMPPSLSCLSLSLYHTFLSIFLSFSSSLSSSLSLPLSFIFSLALALSFCPAPLALLFRPAYRKTPQTPSSLPLDGGS